MAAVAEGINSSGQVAGWALAQPSYWRAFVWDAINGVHTLGTLFPSIPEEPYNNLSGFRGISVAVGISDSGAVFGWSSFNESRGFRWAGGPANEFGVLTGLLSFPFLPYYPVSGGKAVASDTIMMAVGASTILYNNGLVGTLPSLPGHGSAMGLDLNKKGEVCGVAFPGEVTSSEAVLYSGGVINNLNELVSLSYHLSSAVALNDQGWIVVRTAYGMQYVLIPKSVCDPNKTPCITGPVEGSHPRSRFVVLNGTGQAGASIDLLSDNDFMGRATVESDGQWEAVIEPGSGQHGLSAGYAGAQDRSNTVGVTMDYQSPPTSLTDTTPFLSLHKADILVTSSPGSPQKKWYGPYWTHVALYLGGDQDGTPMIAEAVTSGESFGLSQVRALPLDVSTVYQIYPTMVGVYRPISELSRAQRDSIVSWAQGTAARGLQYWNVPTDFLPIGGAWVLWQGGIRVSPRFDLFMAAVRSNTWSTNKFICSTLVWRAYLEGTGGALNFLEGNLMSAAPGSYLQPMTDPAFLTRLGQNFIVPETFVRSGKLRPVW